jgi:hypothetical protein
MLVYRFIIFAMKEGYVSKPCKLIGHVILDICLPVNMHNNITE